MELSEAVVLMQYEGANAEVVGRREGDALVFDKPAQLIGKRLRWLLVTVDRQPVAGGAWPSAEYADRVVLHVPRTVPAEKRPYFASESSGSEDRLKAIAAGLVKEGEPYYQLQKNDAAGVFETDDQAVQQALQDEADGDPYAIEQLALAKTDLLVRDMRRQRCEAMS